MRQLHRTIKKVGDDSGALAYNTAIAAMMEYMNHVRRGERTPHRDEVLPLVQLAAAYAPHLAEELWARLGHTQTIAYHDWPVADAAWLDDDQMVITIHINGKKRAEITVAKGTDAEAIKQMARSEDSVAPKLEGIAIKKEIYVPEKLVNFIV